MNDDDRFARTMAAWFEADAHVAPPPGLYDAVAIHTRSHRPGRSPFAGVRGVATVHGAGRPGRAVLLIAVVGLLVIGFAGGALVGGGVVPRPSVSAPTVAPTSVPVPSPSLPVIVAPAGLSPSLTPEQVGQEVIAMVEATQVGLPSAPVAVTKITLVPPGGTYPFSIGSDYGSLTQPELFWVVEATGTSVVCSSFCTESTSRAYVIDDATGEYRGSGATSLDGLGVPNLSFRRQLADNGLLFVPAKAPTTGVIDSRQIVHSLDHRSFKAGLSANSPLYGTVVTENAAMMQFHAPWWPAPGASRAIWWVGSMDPTAAGDDLIWVVYDATTGALLDTNAR
jgi:hypothetical protein